MKNKQMGGSILYVALAAMVLCLLLFSGCMEGTVNERSSGLDNANVAGKQDNNDQGGGNEGKSPTNSGGDEGTGEQETFPGLDLETERYILQAHYDELLEYVPTSKATLDDFFIKGYYGTYNGAVVVWVGMVGQLEWGVPGSERVAGIIFKYPTINDFIEVWKERTFYRLQEAYDSGLLTQEDLESIRGWHKTENSQYY